MSLISLMPEDFAVGTLPVGDMEVLDAKFEIYDYDGKVQFNQGNEPPCSLRLDVRMLADGTEHTEWISAGSSANVVPTSDGLSMQGQSEAVKSIYANTKLALFLVSLLAKGYPKSALDKFKSTSLIGLQFTAERPASPDSDMPTNTVRTDGKERKDRPRTHIAVAAIIKLPPSVARTGGRAAASSPRATGKPPAGATAASKATMGTKPTKADEGAAAAAAANGNGDMNERAVATLMTMLEKAEGNAIPVTGLKVKGFSALRGEDKETREEILAFIQDEEWVTGSGFTITDGVVTM